MTAQPSVGEIDLPKPGLPRYLSQLDGIRAVAVLMVIAHHFSTWGSDMRLGIVGVYMFFVLSRFLITRILLGCRDDFDAGTTSLGRSLRQFYIRRFFRIFPLYYLYLAIGIAINLDGIRSSWGWFGSYLGNIFIAFSDEPNSHYIHFWSLAVEEQFYLVWPWLIMLIPRRRLPAMCWLAIFVGVLSKRVFSHLSSHPYAINMLTPDCLDTLASGALVAIYSRRTGSFDVLRRILRLSLLPGLLMLVIGPFIVRKWLAIEYLSIGTCLVGSWLIVRAATVGSGAIAAMLNWPPLRYLGTISYGIYVWHMAAAIVLSIIYRRLHLAKFGPNGELLGITALAIVMASASWWLYERPINELKAVLPLSLARGNAAPGCRGIVGSRASSPLPHRRCFPILRPERP